MKTSIKFKTAAFIAMLSTPSFANESEKTLNQKPSLGSLGAKIDCTHSFNRDKGQSQDCLVINGLRYVIKDNIHQNLSTTITIDPYAAVSKTKNHLPDFEGPRIHDTSRNFFSDYTLGWQPRPNLLVTVENFGGTTFIPSTSNLPQAASLQDSGWDQTALTISYKLAAFSGMGVKFAAGNGEGENTRNADTQQYFGFEAKAEVAKGVEVKVGASLDGNTTGSDNFDWYVKELSGCGVNFTTDPTTKGASTQRIGFSVTSQRAIPSFENLSLGFGWQRITTVDLNKDVQGYPTIDEQKQCTRYYLDHLFVETADNSEANHFTRTTYNFSARYDLDSYFVGLDFESRTIDSGSVEAFQKCEAYEGYTCPDSLLGDTVSTIGQQALTVGIGSQLDPQLTLIIDYSQERFDDNYAKAFYPSTDGKASDTFEQFNARLSFNWH